MISGFDGRRLHPEAQLAFTLNFVSYLEVDPVHTQLSMKNLQLEILFKVILS